MLKSYKVNSVVRTEYGKARIVGCGRLRKNTKIKYYKLRIENEFGDYIYRTEEKLNQLNENLNQEKLYKDFITKHGALYSEYLEAVKKQVTERSK